MAGTKYSQCPDGILRAHQHGDWKGNAAAHQSEAETIHFRAASSVGYPIPTGKRSGLLSMRPAYRWWRGHCRRY
jgi:hypothetical protein